MTKAKKTFKRAGITILQPAQKDAGQTQFEKVEGFFRLHVHSKFHLSFNRACLSGEALLNCAEWILARVLQKQHTVHRLFILFLLVSRGNQIIRPNSQSTLSRPMRIDVLTTDKRQGNPLTKAKAETLGKKKCLVSCLSLRLLLQCQKVSYSLARCSEFGSLKSLDVPELHASSDVREPISLHQAVVAFWRKWVFHSIMPVITSIQSLFRYKPFWKSFVIVFLAAPSVF